MNDLPEMDEQRKRDIENRKLQMKMLKEQMDREDIAYLANHRTRVDEKRAEIMLGLANFNSVNSSALRFSLPTIDAMLFMLACVPPSIGMELMKWQSYVDTVMTLRALRLLLVQERDAVIKNSSYPGLIDPIPPSGAK